MIIRTNNVLQYFELFIAVQSALMDRRYKLTPKEQRFLALCAAYNSQGGNLHDFEELSAYLISQGIVGNTAECSVYKNRLSIKKWITTGRGRFKLPAALSKPKGYDLGIRYHDGADSGDGQEISGSTGAGPGVPSSGRSVLRSSEGRDAQRSISDKSRAGLLHGDEGIS